MAKGSQPELGVFWAVVVEFCQAASFRFRLSEAWSSFHSEHDFDQNSLWRVLRENDQDGVGVWNTLQYTQRTGQRLPASVSAAYDYNNDDLYINPGQLSVPAKAKIIHEATHAYADLVGLRLTKATHEFLGFFMQSLYLKTNDLDLNSLVQGIARDNNGRFAQINDRTICFRCAALAEQLGVIYASSAPVLSPAVYGEIRSDIARLYKAADATWDPDAVR
jgi:hypothetical protein